MKACKDLDSQKGAEFEQNHWEITPFTKIDNNLIDSVFSNLLTLSEDQ